MKGKHELDTNPKSSLSAKTEAVINPEIDETNFDRQTTVKRGKKIPGWKVITAAVLVVFLVLVGTACLFVDSKLSKISYEGEEKAFSSVAAAEAVPASDIVSDDIDIIGSSEPPEGDIFVDKDIVNLLLIGTDAGGGGPNDPGRADCVMLCSLNKKTGDVKLISFERGILVQFDVEPKEDILTHTFVRGGCELVQEMIEKYFLLDILGYVHVDYDSFITGIDAIGGVDIELTEREADGLNGKIHTNAVTKATVNAGMNHLDGYDALQYCRQRFIDSDWQRIERQRNTVQAALNQAKTLSLKQLNDVADQMLPLIETNLSKSDIVSLLFHMTKFIGAEAGQMTVPEHTPGEKIIWCHFDKETARIMTFIYGEEAAKHYNEKDIKKDLF